MGGGVTTQLKFKCSSEKPTLAVIELDESIAFDGSFVFCLVVFNVLISEKSP